MEGDKTQFDILLGGSEWLPAKMSIMNFAKARAQEIAALTEAIDDPQKTAQVFQRLPKIMRRRVMSHNAKRMPRRLREAHLKQLEKSGLPPKSKRPSRKHRRRPSNLLLEYNRRKKKCVWLETHIWHAKRFHMIQKWGYKVANIPNDKTYRACYRASINHCLLQDISYYCCIELSGPQECLLSQLSQLTRQECGLTFAARAFLSGTREGQVTMFRRGLYPLGAIGTVTFLWKPQVREGEERILWIWVHPSLYADVLNELIDTFSFTPKMVESNLEKDITSPAKKKAKLEIIEEVQITAPSLDYKDDSGQVHMVLLKDTLNRFRLTGPLSQAVLLDALNVCALPGQKPMAEKADDIEEIFCSLDNTELITLKSSSDEDMEVLVVDKPGDSSWWTRFYSDKLYRDAWQTQRQLWSDLKNAISPAQLSPHQVLPLIVLDPRYQIPSRRRKVVPQTPGEWAAPSFAQPAASACHSPLWNCEVRTEVTRSKISKAEFDRIRAKNLVPGFRKEELVEDQGVSVCSSTPEAPQPARVPLLLIQRPGSQDPEFKRLGFECGWDIILPAGWAMPLWLALIFRGVRVGGLKQMESLTFEAGGVVFAPDTAAGQREASLRALELTDKHFRLPPAKRPNYLKLGSASPFKCCWDVLVLDWYGDPSYFVLRDRSKLDILRTSLSSCKTVPKNSRKRFRQHKKFTVTPKLTLNDFPVELRRCLVLVKVTFMQKGTPLDFAMICLPSEKDLLGVGGDEGPVEMIHEDGNSTERKAVQQRHDKLLRRLRRARIRAKRKIEVPGKKTKRSDPPTKELVEKHAHKMRALWLPEPTTVKSMGSRQVIGYVTKGDFSLTEACGVGVGYVVLRGLVQLLESESSVVLVRNPGSSQYRFAVLQVC